MQNGTDTLEQFGSSYKIKHTLTKISSNHISCYVPSELKIDIHTKSALNISLFIIAKNLE